MKELVSGEPEPWFAEICCLGAPSCDILGPGVEYAAVSRRVPGSELCLLLPESVD